jgi:hypothetical protein
MRQRRTRRTAFASCWLDYVNTYHNDCKNNPHIRQVVALDADIKADNYQRDIPVYEYSFVPGELESPFEVGFCVLSSSGGSQGPRPKHEVRLIVCMDGE